jgi:hypothetical protein
MSAVGTGDVGLVAKVTSVLYSDEWVKEDRKVAKSCVD